MINLQVSMMASQLLSDWLKQDDNILEIECDNYMAKRTKENTKEENINTIAKTNMEIEVSGQTKIKCKGWDEDEISKETKWKAATNKGWNKEEKHIEKNVEEKEENYYKTLSEKEDEVKDKFKEMEVVEEENGNEMKIEKEFIAYTIQKERCKYKNKILNRRGKSEMKKQWEKIKDKMEEFVRTIDRLDLEKNKFHA